MGRRLRFILFVLIVIIASFAFSPFVVSEDFPKGYYTDFPNYGAGTYLFSWDVSIPMDQLGTRFIASVTRYPLSIICFFFLPMFMLLSGPTWNIKRLAIGFMEYATASEDEFDDPPFDY